MTEHLCRTNSKFIQRTRILLFLVLICSLSLTQSQEKNIGITLVKAVKEIDSKYEGKIWPNFTPQKYIFELTDSLQNVFGIGFSPNADSPNREQRAILINNYLTNISGEEAISLIVHEAFHSFQEAISKGGSKWPSENASLIKDYDELSARNNTLLNIEGNLLYESLQAISEDSLIKKLGYFTAVRKFRQKEIASHLVEFEIGAESNEGLAEYAGVKSVILGLDSSNYPHLVTQFKETNQKKFIKERYKILRNLSSIKRNIRRRFYYTGSAQALLLDQIRPEWKSNYRQGNKALQDLIEEFVQKKSTETFNVNSTLDRYDYKERVREEQVRNDKKKGENLRLLDSLLSRNSGQIIVNVSSLKKMGNYLGFDPMNMISVDRQNKIHPLLSAGLNDNFKFESNKTTIENLKDFEYTINSAFDKSTSIVVDGTEIGSSSINTLEFKHLEIHGAQFLLEAQKGNIQILNNQLIITLNNQ